MKSRTENGKESHCSICLWADILYDSASFAMSLESSKVSPTNWVGKFRVPEGNADQPRIDPKPESRLSTSELVDHSSRFRIGTKYYET